MLELGTILPSHNQQTTAGRESWSGVKLLSALIKKLVVLNASWQKTWSWWQNWRDDKKESQDLCISRGPRLEILQIAVSFTSASLLANLSHRAVAWRLCGSHIEAGKTPYTLVMLKNTFYRALFGTFLGWQWSTLVQRLVILPQVSTSLTLLLG